MGGEKLICGPVGNSLVESQRLKLNPPPSSWNKRWRGLVLAAGIGAESSEALIAIIIIFGLGKTRMIGD